MTIDVNKPRPLIPGQRYKFGSEKLYVRVDWPPLPVRAVTRWRGVTNQEFMYIGLHPVEYRPHDKCMHTCLLTDGTPVYVTSAQFGITIIVKV